MKKCFNILAIICALFAGQAYSSEQDILATLSKIGLDKKDVQIQETNIPNFKSVITSNGLLYISDDGKYLAQGAFYDMSGDYPKDEANSINLALIQKIDDSAVVYKAKDEKYVVYVFTDPTCGYCKKLHEDINQYLDEGISVHYFAFPRAGLDSETAKQLEYAWNTADRKASFDALYKGLEIQPIENALPYVKAHFDTGRQIGVTGTPAIVLPTGQLLSGYVPANELIKLLEQTSK